MKNHFTLILLFILSIVTTATAQVPVLNSYPSAKATIFLDFDGQTVTGTAYNGSGPIFAQPSELSTEAITEIFNRIAEDYRPFNLNITTDSTAYFKAPLTQRMRVIFTTTSSWTNAAGGISFVGSFTNGTETPAFVFNQLLGNGVKAVAEAASHETGHTLGLQHQSIWSNNCKLISEYNGGQGEGEIGWAPIMGVGYYKNLTTWHVGTSRISCNYIQNDLDVIASTNNNFGFREDDHGDNSATATLIKPSGHDFIANGLINRSTDLDAFKIVVTSTSNFKLKAIPQNVGNGNEGADVDIRVTLENAAGETLNSYNPGDLLDAGIDTSLTDGTYYLIVNGVGNINHSDYGSLGYYALTGTLAANLPITNFTLKGAEKYGVHQLSWTYEANEPIKDFEVEASNDGRNFSALTAINASTLQFSYQPVIKSSYQYRIKAITARDGKPYYSNIVSLSSTAEKNKVKILNSFVQDNLQLTSDGKYAYQLIDTNGKLLNKGVLQNGYNSLPVNSSNGLVLLRWNDGYTSHTEKLIKQ